MTQSTIVNLTPMIHFSLSKFRVMFCKSEGKRCVFWKTLFMKPSYFWLLNWYNVLKSWSGTYASNWLLDWSQVLFRISQGIFVGSAEKCSYQNEVFPSEPLVAKKSAAVKTPYIFVWQFYSKKVAINATIYCIKRLVAIIGNMHLKNLGPFRSSRIHLWSQSHP